MNISYMLYIITINTQGVPTAEKTHRGREPSIYNNNNNVQPAQVYNLSMQRNIIYLKAQEDERFILALVTPLIRRVHEMVRYLLFNT